MSTRPGLGLPKKLAFALLAYALFEGALAIGLWGLARYRHLSYDPLPSRLSDDQRGHLEDTIASRRAGTHRGFDAVLGWKIANDANEAGMRDDREYDPQPPPGVVRIAAFGDSFTYGSDVKLHEAWARRMVVHEPTLEVLNFGVGAYGLDQAYLRYRRHKGRHAPHIVFIGYMSENLERHVNVFRPFYSRAYGRTIYTKPRFRFGEDGELALLANPIATIEDQQRFLADDATVLRELGANDHHYQMGYTRGPLDFLPSLRLAKIVRSTIRDRVLHPVFTPDGIYRTDNEAFRLTEAIMDAFYREVLQEDVLPILVVFPDIGDQRRNRRGEPRRYAPLLERLDAKGYATIDVLDALEAVEPQHSVDELVVAWGHYSPLGSDIVAQFLVRTLRERGLLDTASVARAARAERARLVD